MKRIRGLFFWAFTFVIIAAGCTHRPYGMPGRDWGHMMDYGYGGIFMWILIILVIAVVLYFILARPRSDSLPPTGQDTPLEILKKRYAKGEISKEEYEQMKRELED